MEQAVEPDALDRRDPGRSGVVIQQNRKGNRVVFDEGAREFGVPGAHDHDFASASLHVRVLVAQLRGVRTAVQSAEVAQEHEHGRPVAPVVPEALRGSVGVLQLEVGEAVEIHRGSVGQYDGERTDRAGPPDCRPALRQLADGNSNNTFTAPDFPWSWQSMKASR